MKIFRVILAVLVLVSIVFIWKNDTQPHVKNIRIIIGLILTLVVVLFPKKKK